MTTEGLELLNYWGKAGRENERDYHPLACHLLDVAAVGSCWLESDRALLSAFARASDADPEIVRAWVLFFLALHDLGKFDLRFQLKVPDLAYRLVPELRGRADLGQAKGFSHSEAGYGWLLRERETYGLAGHDDGIEKWGRAIFAHHGQTPQVGDVEDPWADTELVEQDRTARAMWVATARRLFLEPAGIAFGSLPPSCPLTVSGFCSVCDWLGSNSEDGFFTFVGQTGVEDLTFYYRDQRDRARGALSTSGMVAAPPVAGGMEIVFSDLMPQGFQGRVGDWPLVSGLTLLEAPTGSGKTEVALAYASRLLAASVADGVVFALPTQATANAMLGRIEAFAARLFVSTPHVVLAHGKSRFNPLFKKMIASATRQHSAGAANGAAQCAAWLAESRKRVFLGQVGVCTIDQVLLSVLPVRHYFVRGFGLRRNVLIVDEVHAYDRYMNTLLDRVLAAQRDAGGSAILLSATLPSSRRNELLHAWGGSVQLKEKAAPYPLASFGSRDAGNQRAPETVPAAAREVAVRLVEAEEMTPGPDIVSEIAGRADVGARVALVCNLVDVAQELWREISAVSDAPVDLFHARFRFRDRMQIENRILASYGKVREARGTGSVLVATQVVEQSLDLDFDWLVTQLCPIDLLFQRLGRLHRHQRPRPDCASRPECAVVTVPNHAYGKHLAIYDDPLALWRTERLIRGTSTIRFPSAYRDWLEDVYESPVGADTPPEIADGHRRFLDNLTCSRQKALQIAVRDPSEQINVFELWKDTDDRAARLTRDGDMSLTVVPVRVEDGRRRFLEDDRLLGDWDEWELAEQLNLESVPVPHSWKRSLPNPEDGVYYLPMVADANGDWRGEHAGTVFNYSKTVGLWRERV